MSRKCWTMVCALSVALGQPALARAADLAPGAGRGLAGAARAVFAAKCVLCHGPDLANPRSGFGHVLDLGRLAAEPDKIVPSKPDDSGLWQQIQTEEMPPPNSPSGALTAHEKEAIRAWIAAGAPAEGSAPGDDSPAPPPQEATEPPSSSVVWRALGWLGKFHLVVVHFPIALMVAAFVGELWAAWKGGRAPSPAVRFCLSLGAISAVVAVGLGWLFALGTRGPSELLTLHRWFGTAAGAWAVAIAVFSEVSARRGGRRWASLVLLLAGALLVGMTGHLGALMAHGKHFYDW